MDIDPDALEIAKRNAEEYEIPLDLMLMDVTRDHPYFKGEDFCAPFDTVILNPPFGTKQNWGIDMVFLQRALQVC
jgi:predicted RNA methylase